VTELPPSLVVPSTALHQDTVGQAMLGRPMSHAAGIRGVGWMLQRVPFHRSARSIPPVAVKVNPIAVQSDGRGHATAFSWPPPGGFGMVSIVHVEPSHRSARVPLSENPTARQAEGPVQSTPPKDANWTPDGFGVGWMVQVLPFHRSATVCTTPEAKCCSPAIVQAVGEVHETLFGKVWMAWAGWGVVRMVQVLPFHCSVSGRTGPFCDEVDE